MPSKLIRDLELRESLRIGLFRGVEAWTAYAVVECLFSSVLPWIGPLFSGYAVTNDSFTLFVTVLYLAAGGAGGAAAGILLFFAGKSWATLGRLEADPVLRAIAVSSVIVALLLDFAFYSDLVSPVVMPAIWLVLAILSARSSLWQRRLGVLVNPWTTSAMLLGIQWLGFELMDAWPDWARALVNTGYILAVLLAALFGARILRGSRRAVLAASCSLVVALGLAIVLDQSVLTASVDASGSVATGRPNVILISLDTVRADHTSLYGYSRRTTPNLEALAHDSVVYDEAISPGDMTLSSHASMFTGLYPSRHGAHLVPTRRFVGMPLRQGLPVLPEILSRYGYDSSAVVANYAYLSPSFGFTRGFSHYDCRSNVPFLAEPREYYLRARVRNYLTRWVPESVSERQTRSAAEINEAAFDMLAQPRSGQRPFFLFLNYMDAHLPYLPPPPYDTMYPGKLRRFTLAKYGSLHDDVLTRRRDVTEAERNHLISQYDGGIRYLDDQLGDFLAGLKQKGLYDDSLIIVTSDHGEAFGEHHTLEHGISVYQDQVHVVLMLKYPRNTARIVRGSRVESPVSLVDLLPTILDVAKLPPQHGIEGQSLLSHPAGNVYAESFPNGWVISLRPAFRRVERAAFSGTMKLIGSSAGKRELYDLAADPDEEHNLYLSASATAHELDTGLRDWIQTETGRPNEVPEADRGAVERLKSLGYVQ